MPKAEFDLSQELVVLTGAAGILGSRFARALVRYGARVVLVDCDGSKIETLARMITEELGGEVRFYIANVANVEQMVALGQQVESEVGQVTVLVNNAAAKSQNFFAPFEDFPLEDWDQVMDVNVTGVMLGCQVFGPAMAKCGYGSIINILSIYGVVAPDQRIYEGSWYEGRAINTPAVYSTSKAAVWGLTRYLATYWGNCGVRVNAISPGGVYSGQNDEFVKRYSARVPMGRMAEPDEMCGALIYLASRASSYVTGQNIIVDGGLTVW
jgi:NAD(P)-dependent dehydrogenase (short-subunit alcohol dehydrogenase family)